MRPSMESICMEVAKLISQRSICKTPDRKIGCVIVNSDYTKLLAWGYNGTAKGDDNVCDYTQNLSSNAFSRCSCVHSEMNAIAKLSTFPGENLYLFVTMLPCTLCARLIVNVGQIKKVFYGHEYRNDSALTIFNKANIEVVKI